MGAAVTNEFGMQAIAIATENGRTAAAQGGLLSSLDSLWETEMAHGDWADVLNVIGEEQAKAAYRDGLRAGCLFSVADAILDDKGYRDENAASVDAVKQYADGAMDIDLSDEEAKRIFDACQAWLAAVADENANGSAYYQLVMSPLK